MAKEALPGLSKLVFTGWLTLCLSPLASISGCGGLVSGEGNHGHGGSSAAGAAGTGSAGDGGDSGTDSGGDAGSSQAGSSGECFMPGPRADYPSCYVPGPETVNFPCLSHSEPQLLSILAGGPFSGGPWVAADPTTCEQLCCYR